MKNNIIVPFWSWNDKLEIDELKRQISLMKKSGIDGFFMHARGGLETDYLSDDWFDCIKACMDEAEKLNMEAWAYDENGWPSGFANGVVPKQRVEFQQKRLEIKTLSLDEQPPENLLGLYRINENGFDVLNNAEENCIAIYYSINPYYIDTFNIDAIKCFIEQTHEKYYEHFKESFGKSLKGFFTDEPQYAGYAATPWSTLFPSLFFDEYGYNLIEKLPLLYYDFNGYEAFRSDFYNMIAKRFRESFIKQMYDWCTEHNCKLTGHMMGEETLNSQLATTGGVMPCYEYFHVPGIDWLGRDISSPFIPKQLGSVARQLGRKTLSESFALCGWDVSLNELKWIAQWQLVNGVTTFCPHLQGYTLRGQRKRDYPASLFYQLPWFHKGYKTFSDYICKIGSLLDDGIEEAPILLIQPLQTAYIYRNISNGDKLTDVNNNFVNITNELSGAHILYHYGDESIIENNGSIKNGKLIIGQCEYDTVILPNMISITENTLKLLTEFSKNGGKVYYIGEMPTLVNGRKNSCLEFINAEKVSIDSLREKYSFANITTDDIQNPNIHYTKRTMQNGSRLYYLVNLSADEQIINLTLDEEDFYIYDVLNDTKITTDGILTFAPYASFVIVAEENAKVNNVENLKTENIPYHNSFYIDKNTINAITLDTCRYKIDDEKWHDEIALIRLRQKLLELKRPCNFELEFSFDILKEAITNNMSLCLETPEKFEILINNNPFSFNNEGYFTDSSIKKCNISKFVHEGKNTITLKGVFYQNENVYRVLFTEDIHESEINKLTYDTELESIYITGSFGVNTKDEITYGERKSIFAGKNFVLTKMPETVDISKITENGFLFFSGEMNLTQNINVNKKDNTRYIFDVAKLNSPAAEIIVNGKYAGVLAFAPFRLDITELLQNGENHFMINLLSGNRNLLGPHHKPQGEVHFVAPSTFTDKYRGWPDDSSYPAWTDNYSFVKFGIEK